MRCSLAAVVFYCLAIHTTTVILAAPLVDVAFTNLSASDEFVVRLNGLDWFRSGGAFVRGHGELFTSADGSLRYVAGKTVQSRGADNLGPFVRTTLTYVSSTRGDVAMQCSVSAYAEAVLFEQQFPRDIAGTSCGDADGLASGFPVFVVDDPVAPASPAGYAHWVSWWYGNTPQIVPPPPPNATGLPSPGFLSPSYGAWNASLQLAGGLGGTGVTCIFDRSGSTAAVLSALDNAMAVNAQSPRPGLVQLGVMGNATLLLRGVAFRSLIYAASSSGSTSVGAAVRGWGAAVRRWFGKADARTARQKDVTLQYLGYTTDNGAYYYYNTEPGKNYQQTIIDVHDYAVGAGIPYRYALIDSWFYYRGSNGGVANWTARPDVFPDGFDYVYRRTGWLVQAHNRYWSADNVYARQNGGQWDFAVDNSTDGAVPLQQRFWTDELLAAPRSAWGLRVYEQDWLFNEFAEYVSDMLTDVTLARRWLLQMGRAAASNGLTIQYCMPYMRFMIQSAEVPAVTQARSSDDYNVYGPGRASNVPNWQIGGQSLLFDALGVAPSKDGFWTTTWQPGNPYGDQYGELCPRLQSAVATLSAGPVQIGDGVGYSDVALIRRSCRTDGLLLQPSAPAALIDAMLLSGAFGGSGLPLGQIWFAPSFVAARVYGYLFVAELSVDWSVLPADLPYLDPAGVYWAFESNATAAPRLFSSQHPLPLSACAMLDFQLWSIVPVEANGWALQGELDKWVGVSEARIVGVETTDAAMQIRTVGAPYESATFAFVNPAGQQVTVTCTYSELGALVVDTAGQCN